MITASSYTCTSVLHRISVMLADCNTTRYLPPFRFRSESHKARRYREGMAKAKKLFRFLAERTIGIIPVVLRRPLYRPRRSLSLCYVLRVAFQRKRQELRKSRKRNS